MMRVAQLYSERPEIFRNVGWRALTQLALPATSPETRRKFEARILAGERVNGAEIIRAGLVREGRGKGNRWPPNSIGRSGLMGLWDPLNYSVSGGPLDIWARWVACKPSAQGNSRKRRPLPEIRRPGAALESRTPIDARLLASVAN
jgi:hypothetical protein